MGFQRTVIAQQAVSQFRQQPVAQKSQHIVGLNVIPAVSSVIPAQAGIHRGSPDA